jgi:hypothetical protein
MEPTIPTENLVVGGIYVCRARFFNIGFWTGTEFRGVKNEYDQWTIVSERPWEDGLPLGTACAVTPLNTKVPLRAFDGGDVVALLLAAEELFILNS